MSHRGKSTDRRLSDPHGNRLARLVAVSGPDRGPAFALLRRLRDL